jgi:hypothetical protein
MFRQSCDYRHPASTSVVIACKLMYDGLCQILLRQKCLRSARSEANSHPAHLLARYNQAQSSSSQAQSEPPTTKYRARPFRAAPMNQGPSDPARSTQLLKFYPGTYSPAWSGNHTTARPLISYLFSRSSTIGRSGKAKFSTLGSTLPLEARFRSSAMSLWLPTEDPVILIPRTTISNGLIPSSNWEFGRPTQTRMPVLRSIGMACL